MQYPHEYVQVSVTRRYVSNTYIPVFESHTRTREFESHTFQKLVYVFETCTYIQKPSKVFLYVCTGFKYVLFQIRYTFKYVYFQIRILSNTYTFKYVYFQIRLLPNTYTLSRGDCMHHALVSMSSINAFF